MVMVRMKLTLLPHASFYILIFSGGHAPRPPPEKVAFGHLNSHSHLLLYGQTPTSNLIESPGEYETVLKILALLNTLVKVLTYAWLKQHINQITSHTHSDTCSRKANYCKCHHTVYIFMTTVCQVSLKFFFQERNTSIKSSALSL